MSNPTLLSFLTGMRFGQLRGLPIGLRLLSVVTAAEALLQSDKGFHVDLQPVQ
jgi:hypothetical protein